MSAAPGWIGATVHSEPYRVELAAMVAYARATNDDNPAHLSGRVAAPLFAVVPALKTLARAKRLATDAFTLHGEHDLWLHRPIVAGMTLTVEATLVGARDTPAGTALIVHGRTRMADGILVNEQYLVSVAHGRHLADDAGTAAPAHHLPAGLREAPAVARRVYGLDADQTRRYAEASGDRDPYTYDEAEAAKRGLPGPIVHGLCTMAFAGRAVVATACGDDSRRLKRFAVRFSRLLMMRPGQQVATTIWAAGTRPDRALFALEAADADGGVVLRNGWAEVEHERKERGRD